MVTKRLVFVGANKVGKTSLLNYFLEKDPDNEIETVIVKYRGKIVKLDGSKITHVDGLSDVTSHVRFVVYDITNRDSFETAKTFMKSYKTHKETIPYILIGNKLDLGEQRQVSFVEADKLARDNKVPFIEVSGKTGQNVHNALKLMLNIVVGKSMKTKHDLLYCPIDDEKAMMFKSTNSASSKNSASSSSQSSSNDSTSSSISASSKNSASSNSQSSFNDSTSSNISSSSNISTSSSNNNDDSLPYNASSLEEISLSEESIKENSSCNLL